MSADLEACYRHPDERTGVHCTRCGRPICPDCMTEAPVGHHCPTCVAEAGKGVRRVRRPLPRPRSVTSALLALNIGVFVAGLLLGGLRGQDPLLEAGAMVPIAVAQGEWWRLVTAMFLHVGPMHLAFNALALYVFGALVEQALGAARYLAVYLVAGFAASAFSFALGSVDRAAAGASGAVFCLLGAWLVYNLRRRSLSLARSNVQGALMLIAINVAIGFAIPRIDNLAHLGGLAAGIAAGFLAEGFGPWRTRRLTRVGGLAALTLAAIALAAWRIGDLSGPLT